jgi:hypothetical protein
MLDSAGRILRRTRRCASVSAGVEFARLGEAKVTGAISTSGFGTVVVGLAISSDGKEVGVGSWTEGEGAEGAGEKANGTLAGPVPEAGAGAEGA